MHGLIDTDKFSSTLRDKSVDTVNRRLLITRLEGSEQESDFTVPANCGGLGRIRHFNRETSAGWPDNPLPIDPACRALQLPPIDSLRGQVFQNASCNWRCWYCYVPFPLLNGDPTKSEWVTAGDLIDRYLQVDDRPSVIDLTGGQPDLVPEWVPWMMEELRRRGLHDEVYLWSDDNLSNDYFWRYLSDGQREIVNGYKNYGKVLCFKGFDEESFEFNTRAPGNLLGRQFDLCDRYMQTQIDIYGYATFTTPSRSDIAIKMKRFVDRLQSLTPNLPLRVVPLEIRSFAPVSRRMTSVHHDAIANQSIAIEAWMNELVRRFSSTELAMNICEAQFCSEAKS